MMALRRIFYDVNPFNDATLKARAQNLNRSNRARETLHQKEYQTALKLLILAAECDDYNFAVNYCHALLNTDRGLNEFYIRVLKSVRSLSYLFDEIQLRLNQGLLDRQGINILKIEMIEQVAQKVKSRSKRLTRAIDILTEPTIDDVPEINFEQLFADLERFSENESDKLLGTGDQVEYAQQMSKLDLHFDLNISAHVENFLKQNPNLKTNQFGMIDLGDDMDEEDIDLA
jgi:hypothetical protein